MDAPIKQPEAPVEEGLPFHPLTTLRSLWRRRGVVVIFGALGLVIGLAASFSIGEKRYTSETLILFRPSLAAPDDTGSSLETVLNLVKVPTNLEQVRRTLDDQTPVPALAASFEVAALKNTDLVAIRATADTAARAAARANALRDAFLANQARLAASKGDRQSGLVARQLDEVKSALALADQKRIDIGVKTGVIDIEKQTGTYLQQQASMDIFYGQALADQNAVDQQGLTLEKTAADLKRKIAQEQKEAGSQDDLSSLNIRSGRLRSSIEEDRRDRAARAELELKEAEFKRATDLAAQGLLSKSLLDKARAEYEAQKARAVDTDRIKDWKAELAKIDTGVIPTKANDAPSSGILREVMSKRLDLGLAKTAVAERVKSLDSSRTLIKDRVDQLPELKRQLSDVEREVESLEQRRRTLEDLLAKSRAMAGATSADFTVVSEAIPPLFPKSSNRKLVLAGVVALSIALSLLLIVGVELLDRTLRSSPEISIRTGASALASIPFLPDTIAAIPDASGSAAFPFFSRLAHQLRREHQGNLTVLVTSARRGEGTTFVASHLASALGRLDERVVYVDAQLHPSSLPNLRTFALSHDPMEGGVLLPASVEASFRHAGEEFASRARGVGLEARRKGLVRWSRSTRSVRRRILQLKRVAANGMRRCVRGSRSLHALTLSILRPALPALGPSLSLAPDSTDGLGSYLAYETSSSREITHSTSLVGVSCLPAGTNAGSLSESVAWKRTNELIAELAARHRIVVIDISGVLDHPEAEALADQADLVLVVARAERTDASEIRRALKRLALAKAAVGGVILNGVDRCFVDLLTEAEA